MAHPDCIRMIERDNPAPHVEEHEHGEVANFACGCHIQYFASTNVFPCEAHMEKWTSGNIYLPLVLVEA